MAKDVAVALGFKNVAVAIRNLPHKVIITRQELICQKHTRGSELTQTLFQANGQYRTTLIPESDLYRLVMRSNLPSTQAFQDWVCGTVLPAIRKDGAYIMGEEKGINGK